MDFSLSTLTPLPYSLIANTLLLTMASMLAAFKFFILARDEAEKIEVIPAPIAGD